MPRRNESLPTYRERSALQILLVGEWRAAQALHPASKSTLDGMMRKGWVEREAKAA